MRIYRTTIERDERGDLAYTEGDPVSCLHFREGRSIVRTAPGMDDIAEADLVSADVLRIGDLLQFVHSETLTDIYRVMTVSPSAIGRHQYKLTRKLEAADAN